MEARRCAPKKEAFGPRAALATALAVVAASLQGCGEMAVNVATVCSDGSATGSICRTWSQTGTIADYQIDVTFTCQSPPAPGSPCKSWTQTGQIAPSSSACFPGEAFVLTPDGPKQLRDVQLGEQLLGQDPDTGLPAFSEVRAWLHRSVDAEALMSVLRTAAGRVVASPAHSLKLASTGDYVFARDVQKGQELLTPNGTVTVLSSGTEHAVGFYSPWSGFANFFVGDSPESLVLAHSFAHLQSPRRYESAVRFAMAAAEYVRPNIHDVDETDREYVHPVMRFLAPFGGVSLPTESRRLAGAAAAAAGAQRTKTLKILTVSSRVSAPIING